MLILNNLFINILTGKLILFVSIDDSELEIQRVINLLDLVLIFNN